MINLNTLDNKDSIASKIREKLEKITKVDNMVINFHNKTDMELAFSNTKISTGKYEFKICKKEMKDENMSNLKDLKIGLSIKT